MSTTSSAIQWTDRTWNPVRGCSRVSPGCDSCYAMGQAHRFSGPGGTFDGLTTLRKNKRGSWQVDWTGKVNLVTTALPEPIRWRKPAFIFVNSMSDLFHESLEDEEIDRVFGAMWACLYLGRDPIPGHTFQILTKRAARMREYMAQDRRKQWAYGAVAVGGGLDPDSLWDQTIHYKGPHPRIWLGVSCEDQQRADERIPHLLGTPAAVRFVSAEPLLGPLDLRVFLTCKTPLSWVIVGGESGPRARPYDLAWSETIIAHCQAAGVSVFHKQVGARPEARWKNGDLAEKFHLKDRKGGDMSEWPFNLRVREFPA